MNINEGMILLNESMIITNDFRNVDDESGFEEY
jgi:hypothetical protein